MPYNNNGELRVIILHNTGEIIETLNINQICDIDNNCIPIFGFMNPMITACFDHNGDIFINAFHRFT